MENQASIDINRPIADVFRLTNDHVAEWSIVVVEDRPHDAGETRVGSKSTVVTEDHEKRMGFECTVTEYSPPQRSAVRMIGSAFDIVATYEFEDLGGKRTRVTQTSTVTGKGWMAIFFVLFGWMLKKSSCEAGKKEMQSLKEFCERTNS